MAKKTNSTHKRVDEFEVIIEKLKKHKETLKRGCSDEIPKLTKEQITRFQEIFNFKLPKELIQNLESAIYSAKAIQHIQDTMSLS